MNDTEDLLRSLAVFQNLNDEEFGHVLRLCSVQSCAKGSCIFEEQSPGSDLYVVLSGQVSIQMESITPQCDITIAIIGAQQIFGELALIDSDLRSAKATCLEDTEVITINGEKLKKLFNANHHIGYVVMTNIAKTICSRIRLTNRKLLNAMRVKLF